VPVVTSSLIISADDVAAALAGLVAGQRLHRHTRAVHGAAFWNATDGIVALREDVGRHNALDKLAGALVRQACKISDGLLVVTSRISVEMVQKAARIGAPILVAVSAPTALAVRVAEAAGITLVTSARGNDFEVFTHAYRMAASLIPIINCTRASKSVTVAEAVHASLISPAR
jgi:FdhD protein